MSEHLSSFFDHIYSGSELTEFVSNKVQLPTDIQGEYKCGLHEVKTFLESRNIRWSFKRIVKSGSLFKGTAVRGHADVDLVCFIERNSLMRSPEEFLSNRQLIIEDIANEFGAYFRWVPEGSHWTKKIEGLPFEIQNLWQYIPIYNYHNGWLLNVTLVKKHRQSDYSLRESEALVDIDIIPGFDLYAYFEQTPGLRTGGEIFSFFGSQDDPRKYADEFSASLAEMQRDFIVDRLNRPNLHNLKKLILLVKFWFKTEVKKRFHRIRFPSYLLELFCLHVWQEHLQDTQYDILTWFYRVLEAIDCKDGLECIWTDNYSREEIPWEILEQRPLVVDPANPYNNVAGGTAQWAEVYACARKFKRHLRSKFSVELRYRGVANPPRGRVPDLTSYSPVRPSPEDDRKIISTSASVSNVDYFQRRPPSTVPAIRERLPKTSEANILGDLGVLGGLLGIGVLGTAAAVAGVNYYNKQKDAERSGFFLLGFATTEDFLFDLARFERPSRDRVVKNLLHYQTNYIFTVILIHLLICLMSPGQMPFGLITACAVFLVLVRPSNCCSDLVASGVPDVIGGLFLIYYMLTGTFVFFLFGIVLPVFLVLAHASTRLRKTEVTIKREKIRTLMGLFLAALGQEHDVGESSSTDTCTVM